MIERPSKVAPESVDPYRGLFPPHALAQPQASTSSFSPKPAKENTTSKERAPLHAGLRDLRHLIKEVMIPLLVEVFESKFAVQQACLPPSRLQKRVSEPPEKVRRQLESVREDLQLLMHWCHTCKIQIEISLRKITAGDPLTSRLKLAPERITPYTGNLTVNGFKQISTNPAPAPLPPMEREMLDTDERTPLHAGLRHLRHRIQEVMIPLLVQVFGLQKPQRVSSETVRLQLAKLAEDVNLLQLWCQTCNSQITKALDEMREPPIHQHKPIPRQRNLLRAFILQLSARFKDNRRKTRLSS